MRVGEADSSCQLHQGVPQGSPLSPILFTNFLDPILREVAAITNIQAFADDLILWTSTDRHHSEAQHLMLALRHLEQWAHNWRMTFAPDKCMAMCITRLRRTGPPPSFQFCGATITTVTSFRYLGVLIDNKLTWGPHVNKATTKALRRLQDIRKFCGTFWGTHPSIIHRLISGAVLPILYYASPIWSSVLSSRGSCRPLERVLRLAGILTCGLLRTSSTEVALMLSGLLPPELELRQRLVQFWLRTLSYGEDLTATQDSNTKTSFCSPCDILKAEVRRLTCLPQFKELTDGRRSVQQRLLYPYQPWHLKPPIRSSIPFRDDASSLLHRLRQNSSEDTAWIFTDGSITRRGAGAAALLTRGPNQHYFGAARRSMGLHSSTRMELEAISIGLQLMDILTRHDSTLSTLHIVTDSQAALRALIGGYNTTELVVNIHTLLWQLSEHISDINITWVPGHTNIPENEAADRMAQAIANGSIEGVLSPIPHCLKALRTLLRHHYTNRMHSMWTTLSSGQDLRDSGWRFRPNIRWTYNMDRVSVALTSQFLSGHFPSRQYLHRWTLVDDPHCRFCEANIEDRDHILSRCPRYLHLRTHWIHSAQHDLGLDFTWSLKTLVEDGLTFLAGFLKGVKEVWDRQCSGTTWGPRLTP